MKFKKYFFSSGSNHFSIPNVKKIIRVSYSTLNWCSCFQSHPYPVIFALCPPPTPRGSLSKYAQSLVSFPGMNPSMALHHLEKILIPSIKQAFPWSGPSPTCFSSLLSCPL